MIVHLRMTIDRPLQTEALRALNYFILSERFRWHINEGANAMEMNRRHNIESRQGSAGTR